MRGKRVCVVGYLRQRDVERIYREMIMLTDPKEVLRVRG